MDELINQLDNLTKTMIDQLDTAAYEEVERFVEERQKIIDMIEPGDTLTKQQKERIQLLLQHDSSIVNRMQILMDEAREWLQQRNIAKAQRNVYDSAYSSESILMDRFK